MKEPWDRFVVRFPPSLRRRVEEAARFYRRSINAEIIMRLDNSLNGLPNLAFEHAIEPPMFRHIEKSLRANLSQEEERLVLSYRRLSGVQRQALLDLLTA
jgi:Arc-like DNA binding domain